jgi:chromosome segregation ATPase
MRGLAFVVVISLAFLVPASVHAQSETDRLREALRSTTAQLRSLEDQRAVLQAKQAEAERERDRLRRQTELLKGQVKDAEQAYRQAVEDFNRRLAERDETLEKWKSAYGEAATVARTRDAERAKFESEAATLKANFKSCEAKNTQLNKVSQEILARYETLTPMDHLGIRDPVFGVRRVEHQNNVQDYRDKILDQKVQP